MSIGLPKDSPFADDESAVDSTEPPSLDGAGILIVDEDPAFQLGLKTFVKDFVGFESVFTAANGREALEKLAAESSIEVVTLDYRMPEMDGIAFLEALSKEAPRPLSVIMITGYPSDQLEGQFRSFGSSRIRTEHFLSKPVAFEDLAPMILRAYQSLKTVQSPQPERNPAMTDKSQNPAESGAAKTAGTDETAVVSPAENEAALNPDDETKAVSSLEVVRKKIESLEEKIDRIGRRTPSRFGRFFMDIVKLLILVALVLAAWKIGLIDQFLEWVDGLDLGFEFGGGEGSEPPAESDPVAPDAGGKGEPL